MSFAPSEDSDQPGHPPSLLRVFALRMKKHRVLSYPLSALRRLGSDWVDAQADPSLRWAHRSFCWFCHEAAHIIICIYTLIALTRLAVLLATSFALWTKCLLATGLSVFEEAKRQALQRAEVCLATTVAADNTWKTSQGTFLFIKLHIYLIQLFS